ncbi:IscS subfamily cysteine desulfurase [Patescibacteria group bacterium]|nr:IscS subfamily cysteine desulfurase [Patescibacteria group bacterium]
MTVQQEIQELLKGRPKKFIYLDHAATTYVDSRVYEAMQPFFQVEFGNPGGFYELGKRAADAMQAARETVAGVLGCRAEEIIFTGSGTESDNMAVLGVARKRAKEGKHVIISAIEHHAVERPAEQLEKEGFEVTKVPVDKFGRIRVEDVKAALRDDTVLVSIMYANNEIGTIQPIYEIGTLLKDHKALFHTDACQAAGALDLNVEKLGVDLMTLNGSKIYGPKGVGVLYIRKGVEIQPLVFGGGQERGKRSGTENVANIVGMAKALSIAQAESETENARLKELRDKLIDGLTKIPKTILNGHPELRLPNNVNVSILDIEGEAFTLFLNEMGIYASTGSACTSTSLDPSHVILATGLPYECAHGSVRFSLGRKTTEEEIDYVLEVVPRVVSILRKISPLNLDADKVREKGQGDLKYI